MSCRRCPAAFRTYLHQCNDTEGCTGLRDLEVGFDSLSFGLLLREVFRREVSKRTVRILRSVVILPGLVDLVGILGEHVSEVVLGCIRMSVTDNLGG